MWRLESLIGSRPSRTVLQQQLSAVWFYPRLIFSELFGTRLPKKYNESQSAKSPLLTRVWTGAPAGAQDEKTSDKADFYTYWASGCVHEWFSIHLVNLSDLAFNKSHDGMGKSGQTGPSRECVHVRARMRFINVIFQMLCESVKASRLVCLLSWPVFLEGAQRCACLCLCFLGKFFCVWFHPCLRQLNVQKSKKKTTWDQLCHTLILQGDWQLWCEGVGGWSWVWGVGDKNTWGPYLTNCHRRDVCRCVNVGCPDVLDRHGDSWTKLSNTRCAMNSAASQRSLMPVS